MKFFVEVTVHQHDAVLPDYLRLHESLAEAGFTQRALDGTRAVQPSNGLYMREENVLTAAEVEHDLHFVFMNFPHPCSFQLHGGAELRRFPVPSDAKRGTALSAAAFELPATSYLQ